MAQPPKSEDMTSDDSTQSTPAPLSTDAADSGDSDGPPAQDAAQGEAQTEADEAPDAASSEDSSDAETLVVSSPAPIEDAVHPDAPDAASLPQSFAEMGLSPELIAAVAKMGWPAPTKVQGAAFGPVTAGRDVLVQSQTGSGKTGAFCLPWLAARFEAGDAAKTGVQLLVMTPTRELAKQVCDQLIGLAGDTPLTPLPVYGGTAIGPQFDALKAGVHAVVGTPGRILDHIRRRTLDLSRVRTVVLDEADEMLSMGFLEDIHAILDACPRERQTTLFSATVPSDIERIARRYMKSPESLKLSGDDIAAAQIEHVYYSVPGSMRTRDLLNVVAQEEPGSTLIFCNTREETNIVSSVLRREGFSAEALSSDLSQAAREHVLGAMRKGRLRFLVATDVASRGIDITHISHVFNYSFPQNAESYVHRTGRTGRAGRAGKAISLIGPHDMGNFYHLKLQYPSIEFTEAKLPPADELEGLRKENKLDQISKRFPELVSPDWTLLVRTLSADPRGEQVMAYLLSEAMSAPDPRTQVARDLPEDEEEWSARGRERRGDRGDRDRDRGRRGSRDRDDRAGRGHRDARPTVVARGGAVHDGREALATLRGQAAQPDVRAGVDATLVANHHHIAGRSVDRDVGGHVDPHRRTVGDVGPPRLPRAVDAADPRVGGAVVGHHVPRNDELVVGRGRDADALVLARRVAAHRRLPLHPARRVVQRDPDVPVRRLAVNGARDGNVALAVDGHAGGQLAVVVAGVVRDGPAHPAVGAESSQPRIGDVRFPLLLGRVGHGVADGHRPISECFDVQPAVLTDTNREVRPDFLARAGRLGARDEQRGANRQGRRASGGRCGSG